MLFLKTAAGLRFHWCPACEQTHPIPRNGWAFNESLDRPTFEPSLAQTFMYQSSRGEHELRLCHYFIRDGLIQFCPDSWHGRSDIVALPPLPAAVVDRLDQLFNGEE